MVNCIFKVTSTFLTRKWIISDLIYTKLHSGKAGSNTSRMGKEPVADKDDEQPSGGYFGKYQYAHDTTAICIVSRKSVPSVSSNQLLYVKWM